MTFTVKEAMSSTPEEPALWKLAIDDEINSLNDKTTWVLDENTRSHPLPTQIVLKIKRNSGGSMERFNGRIVGRDIHQVFC